MNNLFHWHIPYSWVKDSDKQFQDENDRETNDTRANERLQTIQKKEADNDFSDDSWDGWDL